jgi:hypothetical protein
MLENGGCGGGAYDGVEAGRVADAVAMPMLRMLDMGFSGWSFFVRYWPGVFLPMNA